MSRLPCTMADVDDDAGWPAADVDGGLMPWYARKDAIAVILGEGVK